MNPKETTEYKQLKADFDEAIAIAQSNRNEINRKDSEYIKLRGAAIMFLEMEKEYANIKYSSSGYEAKFKALISLDAARSVLWDVINDKEIKP